jgi:hypothetical protein
MVSPFCARIRDAVLTDMAVDRGSMMGDYSNATSGSLQTFKRPPGTTHNSRGANGIGHHQQDFIDSIWCIVQFIASTSYRTLYTTNKREVSLHCQPNLPQEKVLNPLRSKSNNHRHFVPLLSTLPGLLRANQSNDPRQLRALRKLLLLGLLIDIRAGSNVIADRQHAVLQRKKLRQRVVEEGCAEGDVGGRLAIVGQAHLELSRWLLSRRFGRGRRRLCLLLLTRSTSKC